jgi:tetratricopeptide (TPR) repeat protein
VREYETALDLIPSTDRSSKRFSTLNNIATVHLNMENYSMALCFYQQLIDALDHVDVPPSNANLISIYQNIGLCYLSVEDYDLALEYFARVLSLTENATVLSKTHSHIADALLGKNAFANAVENYELALKYDSSNADFVIMTHNSIGTAHHLAGDPIEAINHYTKQLELETDANVKSQIAEDIEHIRQSISRSNNSVPTEKDAFA